MASDKTGKSLIPEEGCAAPGIAFARQGLSYKAKNAQTFLSQTFARPLPLLPAAAFYFPISIFLSLFFSRNSIFRIPCRLWNPTCMPAPLHSMFFLSSGYKSSSYSLLSWKRHS